MTKGYNHFRRTAPDNKSLNLSNSLGIDKNENNFYKNCNNTYVIQGQPISRYLAKDSRSKEKLLTKAKPMTADTKSSKRKSSNVANQGCLLSLNPLVSSLIPKLKPRSKSKDEISKHDEYASHLMSATLHKKNRKADF